MFMKGSTARGADVVLIPPPVFFAVSFLIGLGIDVLVPGKIGGRPATAWLGAVPIVVGLTLCAVAVRAFVRSHTTIVPHHEVTHLVTTGPYRFSRNPMYSGLSLVCLGGALIAGSWWPAILLIPAMLIVRIKVIGPEELYLRGAFGDAYESYCRRVRRWL